MAIRLIIQYPAQVGPATGAYPHGVPRNVSAPSAGDGTPWEEAFVKDLYGFLSKLIDDAGIVHSGVADTALASQYLEALQALFLQATQLESAGGTILETTSRLTKTGLEGLRIVRDSATLFTVNEGRGRHIIVDDAESILAASLQKDISATWSLGAAGGASPIGVHPIGADQIIRLFLVSKPDGTSDLAVDTSPVAANFFLDANAIAAGFSDATRYRRFSHLPINGANQLTDFINLAQNPRTYKWVVPINVDMGAVPSANRIAINLSDECPPECEAEISATIAHSDGSEAWYLFTHSDQADSAVAEFGINSGLMSTDTGSGPNQGTIGMWYQAVDSNSDFHARRSGGSSINDADVTVHGWRDSGIVA